MSTGKEEYMTEKRSLGRKILLAMTALVRVVSASSSLARLMR